MHSIVQSDCLEFLRAQPSDSIDLIFCSPPYSDCRLYLEGGEDLGIARDGEAWAAWMLEVWGECRRVCRGLVAFVVDGKTEDYRWNAAPALLMADLHRAGFNLRKPPIFHRIGIPGSGGPDWFRGDTEFIICTARPGKLPWSDNTACGHPPKWAPGGEMSHRVASGDRVNQWGHSMDSPTCAATLADGTKDKRKRPSHRIVNGRDQWGGTPTKTSGEGRKKNGTHKGKGSTPNGNAPDGDLAEYRDYDPPVLANPGNVTEATYTAEQVAAFLQAQSDYQHFNVGGGQMGEQSTIASQNEAPFPEELAERYILSFCPPGGTVSDIFSGSGTTMAVAVRHGRNFRGCDLRQSQVDLALKRIANETPMLFA